jgi:hypothetical protein
MSTKERADLFAKPQVKQAITEIRRVLRAVLPDASFAEREAAALTIADEDVRELLQQDLQVIADRFGDEVLVDGVLYRRHEPGVDPYHSLCGPLVVRHATYRTVGLIVAMLGRRTRA